LVAGVARFPLSSRVCDHGIPRSGFCPASALRRSRPVIVRARDGLRLHCVDLGSGAGAPLLLLHGFTGSHRSWPREAVDRLAERRRVVLVDLPGHGESDAPESPARFAFAAVVADLTDLLDALAIPSAIWAGYSMGGRLALGAGLLAPEYVSGLVLESASPGISDSVERTARRSSDARIADRLENGGIEAFVSDWESMPLFASQATLPDTVRTAQREQRLSNDPAALAACLRGLGVGMQPSLWEGLPHLDCSALLIVGSEDPKFVELNRRMSKEMRGATLAIVPGAGHNVHLERPEEWAALVEGIL